MVMCSVFGCSKRTVRDKDAHFYSFPTIIKLQCEKTLELSTARQTLWLSRLSREDLSTDKLKYARVCNLHFIKGKPSALFDKDNPDWAPSLQLGHDKLRVKPSLASQRYHRVNQRRKLAPERQEQDVLMDVDPAFADDVPEAIAFVECETNQVGGVECQTDVTGAYILQLEEECAALREEVKTLKEQLHKECNLEQEALAKNDERVKFYTGLPNYGLLLVIFNFLAGHIPDSHRNSLPKFKEFFLVLMRLRLNLHMQDLAYRFSISQPTVSRIFNKWIDVMHIRLAPLIKWPEREVLQTSMPTSFKEAFGNNVAVIIDCFEVFIDKPSSLLPRAITWSQYKHHNTVKFLIGITPQGTVSFLSDAWGGRVSDKYLTERSGLLDKLLPGDVVMADRGFDIADSLGFVCAKLLIPSFTRGKSQLSMMDVESTRKIANLRIHVERVIGLVRMKYGILNGTLPIETVTSKDGRPQIDKIATTCCALANLCTGVVPIGH